MFKRMFDYTDRLYKMIKPQKSIYFAIDGVAPRAKMNQQRSRRFRAAKERETLIKSNFATKSVSDEAFDSNCITPGTDFMYRLSVDFKKWMNYKIEKDEFWLNSPAEVIFSGADVPGEGEHKIMDRIRNKTRGLRIGHYRHCMYGMDADLIMLSLASHENEFILLREKMNTLSATQVGSKLDPNQFDYLEMGILRQILYEFIRKLDILKPKLINTIMPTQRYNYYKIFNFNNLPRTNSKRNNSISYYMDDRYDLVIPMVNDFIFLCFFIGNDFIPSLPHCDIHSGSLNYMLQVYGDLLPKLGGFLTNGTSLHLPRIEIFIQEISRNEALYFKQRAIDDNEPAYASEDYKEFYYQVMCINWVM